MSEGCCSAHDSHCSWSVHVDCSYLIIAARCAVAVGRSTSFFFWLARGSTTSETRHIPSSGAPDDASFASRCSPSHQPDQHPLQRGILFNRRHLARLIWNRERSYGFGYTCGATASHDYSFYV